MTTDNKDSKEPVVEDKVEDVVVQEDDVVETPELSPSEQQAVSHGWKPKEKWVEDGGSEEDWVPAKHFLKFGELKKQVIEKDRDLSKATKIVKMMKEHHLNVRDAAYKQALETLRAERSTALEEADFVKAEKLRDQIEDTKERFTKQNVLPENVEREIREVEKSTPAQDAPPSEYYEFLDRNSWYEADRAKQDEMSQEADKIGWAEVSAARANGRDLSPAQIYKIVETKIRKLYPEKFTTPKSPQSSSSGHNQASGGGKGAKLTAEEAEVAKNFGLTPEQYMAQQKGYRGR
jgi:hypothetical protein